MRLFNETGLRGQEAQTSAALRSALDDARDRETVTKADRQFLNASEAKYLSAVNAPARIIWADAVCQELTDFFRLDSERPSPSQALFLVSLAHASCATSDTPTGIDIRAYRSILRRGLRGLSFLGMIEPALYVSLPEGTNWSGNRCISWHLHAVVWGCTRVEIKVLIKDLNQDGWYPPIAEGLRGADWRQIKEGDLGRTLGYILETPCNEYRIGRRGSITLHGEIAAKFKSNKSWARKGSLIKLFHATKGLYLDELAMAGGEGADVLRRAKRRAFRAGR